MIRACALWFFGLAAVQMAAAQTAPDQNPRPKTSAEVTPIAPVDTKGAATVPQVASRAAPAIPALTQSELLAFRGQIAPCWNIASLSAKAQQTPVTVAFALNRNGTLQRDSLRMIGAGKDTRQPVKDAYAAARRAILRCGAKGYKLPLEKFEQWENIEMTFAPERTPSQ